jgi:hypothetical protein
MLIALAARAVPCFAEANHPHGDNNYGGLIGAAVFVVAGFVYGIQRMLAPDTPSVNRLGRPPVRCTEEEFEKGLLDIASRSGGSVQVTIQKPRRPPQPPKTPKPGAYGWAPNLADTVTWTQIVEPHEFYRIVYCDRHGELSERTIELMKIGHTGDISYYWVLHEGKGKSLRADRVVSVVEQITTGHPARIRVLPNYSTTLPAFPLEKAVFRVPQSANPRRTWGVDLNSYTCTCPEGRVRSSSGYIAGQLGFCCPHTAQAILTHLPPDAEWPPDILDFLRSAHRTSIANLV